MSAQVAVAAGTAPSLRVCCQSQRSCGSLVASLPRASRRCRLCRRLHHVARRTACVAEGADVAAKRVAGVSAGGDAAVLRRIRFRWRGSVLQVRKSGVPPRPAPLRSSHPPRSSHLLCQLQRLQPPPLRHLMDVPRQSVLQTNKSGIKIKGI